MSIETRREFLCDGLDALLAAVQRFSDRLTRRLNDGQ